MTINELKAGQGKVELTATVAEKSDIRDFDKNGNKGKVANAVLKDETGEIKLTLWNEDAERINKGDKLKISNGYVGEWKGELQLSAGKFGKIEVLSNGAGTLSNAISSDSDDSDKSDKSGIEEEVF